MYRDNDAPQLPVKFSDVITIARQDLDAISNTPGYTVNFETWHDPSYGEGCHVCFAGAVMSRTLGAESLEPLTPSNYDAHNYDRLMALNCLREGRVRDALLACIGIPKELIPTGLDHNMKRIPDYHKFPEEFMGAIKDIEIQLRSAGL